MILAVMTPAILLSFTPCVFVCACFCTYNLLSCDIQWATPACLSLLLCVSQATVLLKLAVWVCQFASSTQWQYTQQKLAGLWHSNTLLQPPFSGVTGERTSIPSCTRLQSCDQITLIKLTPPNAHWAQHPLNIEASHPKNVSFLFSMNGTNSFHINCHCNILQPTLGQLVRCHALCGVTCCTHFLVTFYLTYCIMGFCEAPYIYMSTKMKFTSDQIKLVYN